MREPVELDQFHVGSFICLSIFRPITLRINYLTKLRV